MNILFSGVKFCKTKQRWRGGKEAQLELNIGKPRVWIKCDEMRAHCTFQAPECVGWFLELIVILHRTLLYMDAFVSSGWFIPCHIGNNSTENITLMTELLPIKVSNSQGLIQSFKIETSFLVLVSPSWIFRKKNTLNCLTWWRFFLNMLHSYLNTYFPWVPISMP